MQKSTVVQFPPAQFPVLIGWSHPLELLPAPFLILGPVCSGINVRKISGKKLKRFKEITHEPLNDSSAQYEVQIL